MWWSSSWAGLPISVSSGQPSISAAAGFANVMRPSLVHVVDALAGELEDAVAVAGEPVQLVVRAGERERGAR